MHRWFSRVAGHSLALPGGGSFDFSFYSDLLRHHGDGASAGITFLFTIIILYLLLQAFLHGGVLRLVIDGETLIDGRFFKACTEFFLRFVVIATGHLLVQGLLLVLCILIVTGSVFHPFAMESDVTVFRRGMILLPVYLLLVLLILMCRDVAKVLLVRKQPVVGVIRAMSIGAGFVFRRLLPLMLFYLSAIGVMVLLHFFLNFARSGIPVHYGGGIVLLFGLAQAVILLRIALRLWLFGGIVAIGTEEGSIRSNPPMPEKIESDGG